MVPGSSTPICRVERPPLPLSGSSLDPRSWSAPRPRGPRWCWGWRSRPAPPDTAAHHWPRAGSRYRHRTPLPPARAAAAEPGLELAVEVVARIALAAGAGAGRAMGGQLLVDQPRDRLIGRKPGRCCRGQTPHSALSQGILRQVAAGPLDELRRIVRRRPL